MSELEDRWRDLGEFIREQRHVGQLSLRKLSEMAGISNPYLSQIERGLRKPSAEILRQIAGALHISAETLYVRAGILDEREGDVDLVAEIRRDPELTEEQKKTLIHIYESFRSEHVSSNGAGAADVAAEPVRTPVAGSVSEPVDEAPGDAPEGSTGDAEASDHQGDPAALDGEDAADGDADAAAGSAEPATELAAEPADQPGDEPAA